jgi:hypothetical protein
MENSKNLIKVAQWVEDIIRSCNTLDQLLTSEKLVQNFERIAGKTYIESICRLKYCLHNKYREVSSGIDVFRV